MAEIDLNPFFQELERARPLFEFWALFDKVRKEYPELSSEEVDSVVRSVVEESPPAGSHVLRTPQPSSGQRFSQ